MGNKFIHKIIDWFCPSSPSNGTVQDFLDKISEEKNLDSLPLGSEEQLMLSNIFTLNSVEVSDIMVPRSEMISAPLNSSIAELTNTLIKNGHTRMPIYKGSLDVIEGIVNLKDIVPYLLDRTKAFSIDNILREALIVSANMPIINLLIRMRNKRMHMAVVVDEYGGTQGLVTIEDILEEIIGDIDDEHDPIKYTNIKVINPKTIEVAARTELRELEKFINHNLSTSDVGTSDEYDTVGGLLMTLVNHVPKVGEVVKYADLNIKVTDADPRKVKKVRITLISGGEFPITKESKT